MPPRLSLCARWKRWETWSGILAVFAGLAVSAPARGDLGVLVADGNAGPYRVSVLVAPVPVRAGPSQWSVLVQDAGGNPVDAAEVSLDVESWAKRFMPWNNYSVKGPMGGLGCLNILARMSLKPSLREALSSNAVQALDEIFFAWLSPRSRVDWAGAPNSWLVLDGSENLVSCSVWCCMS